MTVVRYTISVVFDQCVCVCVIAASSSVSSGIIGQVHDEAGEETCRLIVSAIPNLTALDVPLEVDPASGASCSTLVALHIRPPP